MSYKKLIVECPACEKKFNYYSGEYRPFCSERCRLVDLGQWLDESYRVPSKSPMEIEELIVGVEQNQLANEEDEQNEN